MARPGATDRALVIDYDLFENSFLKTQLSVAGLGQGVVGLYLIFRGFPYVPYQIILQAIEEVKNQGPYQARTCG